VRGRVVDAIIELIHASGRQVTSKEILEHLEERGTSLGNTKNKPAMLAAMLSQETMKKSARLRKVARGVFDIKQ
jgi:repressor of nif and glnA expression